MTYSDSAKGVRITVRRAERECREHGTTLAEVLADVPEPTCKVCHTRYLHHAPDGMGSCAGFKFDAGELLTWLGY
jgi:hypothetical protein